MSQLPELHVIVQFGSGIPSDAQGPALFEFEKLLRRLCGGAWVEVFKELKGDDSKLRILMTPEERANL